MRTAALAVACATLVACGGGGDETQSAAHFAPDAPPTQCTDPEPCPGQLTLVALDGSYTCVDPHCYHDFQCPTGEWCNPLNGACEIPPQCTVDFDCLEGQRCVAGACEIATCDEHADCPWGVCIDGLCGTQPTCDEDADCPAGWECHVPEIGAAVCVPIVQTCADCAPPYLCDLTRQLCAPVVIACDENCSTGVCRDDQCAFCTGDLDCGVDRVCAEGYCVDPPPPPPIVDGGMVTDAQPQPDAVPVPVGVPHDEIDTRLPAPAWSTRPADPAKFAGTLDVMVLPPPDHLDFASPIKLITSAINAAVKGEANVRAGKAKLAHFIGHLHVKMDCTNGMNQALRIPLTGGTSAGKNKLDVIWKNAQAALGGTGVLFYPFPHKVDEGNPEAQADVDTRRAHAGMIAIIRIPLHDWQCRDLALYYEQYKKRIATMKYDSQARPRRFEGAGCTAFGTTFIERTRTVRRSKMVDTWAQQIQVGLSTIGPPAKVAGALDTDQYPYGSSLVAWIGGQWKRWPINAKIPSRNVVQAADLAQWVNGNEDAVPLTLFDTEPMWNYIEAVHNGTDNDMWDKATESDGKVKVIIRKRPCDEVLPRNPNADDLRRDE